MGDFFELACQSFFEKLSAANPQDMQRTIERLEKLDREPPDPKQLARYSLLGAGVAPLTSIVKDTIKGNDVFRYHPGAARKIDVKGTLRNFAGDAVVGAVTTGLLPVLRHRMDRDAEMSSLRDQIAAAEKVSTALIPSSNGSPAQRLASARRIGSARMTNLSGPSIAQVSRTMGPVQPGAAKGTL